MDYIFEYSRKQAIEDGVLIDVSKMAKEAGFKIPVAMTLEVWGHCVSVPDGVSCQDEAGRLWDALQMLRFAIARDESENNPLLYKLLVRNSDKRSPQEVTLKAVCGPNDDHSPCITIMFPDQD